jgi:hypothetical protein
MRLRQEFAPYCGLRGLRRGNRSGRGGHGRLNRRDRFDRCKDLRLIPQQHRDDGRRFDRSLDCPVSRRQHPPKQARMSGDDGAQRHDDTTPRCRIDRGISSRRHCTFEHCGRGLALATSALIFHSYSAF